MTFFKDLNGLKYSGAKYFPNSFLFTCFVSIVISGLKNFANFAAFVTVFD